MSGRQRTRGFVLLPVVLLLALLAVIGYLYNQAGALQGHLLSDGEDMDQARYVAEAGLNHALARTRLAGCGPYTDLTDEPFGTAHYSTTLALNNVGSTLTTVRVPVTDDAWLEQNNGSANHGSDTVLQLGSSLLGTASDWPVIRFDIANAGIPAGASVVSAVAYLYVEQFTHSLPVTVHRLTAAWNESTVTWNSLGSSYDSTVTTSISAGTASGRYVAVNLSGLVQSWLAGAQPNDGIVLIPNVLNVGQTSRYASKEDSNAAVQPYLSITYTDGPLADRATLTATGILATGTRDTLVRSGVPLYQLPTARVVQFGSELRDTSVRGTNPDRNYGADKKLYVDGGLNVRNSLLAFDLAGLVPPGAEVRSARLDLYLSGVSAMNNGQLDLYRVTRAWLEGIQSGSTPGPEGGATYNSADGTTAWTTPGGDFAAVPVASVIDNDSSAHWIGWDITDAMDDWLAGTPNYGLLLRAGNSGVSGATFASSDETDPTLHPMLTLDIACTCGVVCQAPAGHGRLLLVVDDPGALRPADQRKMALFESWGYTVTLLDDDMSQTGVNDALANADAVYVSDSASATAVGNKLNASARGVINEKAALIASLGLAAGGGQVVSDRIDITDNTHFLTALFPLGTLPLSDAGMENTVITGSPAAGLQSLATIGGATGLAVLDTGATLYPSGTAPARRVQLPIGRIDYFNWDHLNNNGLLLVQRAIQWAVDGAPANPGIKVYWTDDVADKIQRADADGSNVEDVLTGLNQPTGLDIDTVHGKIYWTNRQQIQRANLDGTNIETLYTDSVNTFDIKVDPGGGNIYWTHDNGNSRVMRANLDGSGVTTINNSMNRPSYFTLAPTQNNIYYTNYGDGSVTRTSINGSSLMTLTTGPTGAVGNAVDLTNGRLYWSGGASNDWIRSANLDGSNVQTIVNGLNAPQDIAYDSDHDRIYWVDALNHVVQRANADGSNVETIVGGLGRPRGIVVVSAAAVPPTGGGSGGGGGGGPVCNGTFRDEFNSTNYTGNDGTLTWTGDWQEVNESDGPQRGDEQVAPDPTAWSTPGTDQARVRNSAEGLQRELDLTGAGTATLSLYYRRNYLDSSSDYVSVQMSSNGTAGPWTEVARFQGGGTDRFYIPISTDVSAFISATTAIRLISSPTLGSRDDVWFDNIQIQCTP